MAESFSGRAVQCGVCKVIILMLDKQSDRQTDNQIDRQERQTGTWTDRQTHTHTNKQSCSALHPIVTVMMCVQVKMLKHEPRVTVLAHRLGYFKDGVLITYPNNPSSQYAWDTLHWLHATPGCMTACQSSPLGFFGEQDRKQVCIPPETSAILTTNKKANQETTTEKGLSGVRQK